MLAAPRSTDKERAIAAAEPQSVPARSDIRAVAEMAGVALSSVSRAMNGHPDVSVAMRSRVLAAANAVGYEPDLLAKSLRRGTTQTVGFVVRDISNPLFADIVKGAEDTLRRSGYSMLLTNSEGYPDLDASYIRLFQQRRTDGLIVSMESETHPATLKALSMIRRPIVLLDRDVPSLRAAAVICDHRTGVRDAVSHLLQLGHRRIGLIVGSEGIRATRERVAGYLDAHDEAAVSVDQRLVRKGSYLQEFGAANVRELLALKRAPTALVAGGVQLAVGAISAMHHMGVRLGKDLGFVTCDETALMEVVDPPIAVVARDAVRMGELAASLLLEMLTDLKPPRVEVIPTRFVPRASVGGKLSPERAII